MKLKAVICSYCPYVIWTFLDEMLILFVRDIGSCGELILQKQELNEAVSPFLAAL